MSSQKVGKYACLEIERRYLLNRLPEDLNLEDNYWQIEDRYIPGSRLRLRTMTSGESGKTIYKFGQKFQNENQSSGQVTMTNLYLNEAEYQLLAQLEAHVILKKRYRYTYKGKQYGIDVFEGALSGLILAEIECETIEEYEALACPSFAAREVTDDFFFTGGNLVTLSHEEFQTAFQDYC